MNQTKFRKELAEQVISLFFNGDEKPSDNFMQNLELLASGSISYAEMAERTINSYLVEA